jgi:hypothetical protein
MEPKQAWGAFSVVFVLVDALAGSVLVSLGYDLVPAAAIVGIVALIYFYILYKRYHVEVVPESDIMLFDDVDDLRILCVIYGLKETGNESALRRRLVAFSRANSDTAFTWVAPKSVLSVGSSLSIESGPQVPGHAPPSSATQLAEAMLTGASSDRERTSILPRGESRSTTRLGGIRECPVCGSRTRRARNICSECGADLEFYAVLSESKVGKMMISTKASAVRRKPRYLMPPSGDST